LSHVPFPFTEQASTILLAVHLQFLGSGDTLFPPHPEVQVIKKRPFLAGEGFGYFFNGEVILEFTIKKGGCKTVKSILSGNLSGSVQPQVVTGLAAGRLPEHDSAHIIFQRIILGYYERQIHFFSVIEKGVEAFPVFIKGMYIGVVKIAGHLVPFIT